jgi:hypothetical protein
MIVSKVDALAVAIGLMGCVAVMTAVPWVRDAQAASDSGVWGQDPFGLPPGAADDPGRVDPEPTIPAELQGIIAGPEGMVAIIDSRIVRVGDRLGGEIVEEITTRAVLLRRGSYVRRLAISVLPTHGR